MSIRPDSYVDPGIEEKWKEHFRIYQWNITRILFNVKTNNFSPLKTKLAFERELLSNGKYEGKSFYTSKVTYIVNCIGFETVHWNSIRKSYKRKVKITNYKQMLLKYLLLIRLRRSFLVNLKLRLESIQYKKKSYSETG